MSSPFLQVQLFNLTSDPTERHDISGDHPDVVLTMLKRLDQLEATMIPPDVAPESKKGNPNNFGGVFSTGWCKAQPEADLVRHEKTEKEVKVVIEAI